MSLFEQYLRRKNNVSVIESIAKPPLEFVGEKKDNEFKFDVDKCIEKARKGEKLSEATINIVCAKVKEIFIQEENIC